MGWKRRLFGALLLDFIISAGPDAVKPYFQRVRFAPGGEVPARPSKKLTTKYQRNSPKMIDKRGATRYHVSRYP